jgi:hypothetical protein
VKNKKERVKKSPQHRQNSIGNVIDDFNLFQKGDQHVDGLRNPAETSLDTAFIFIIAFLATQPSPLDN